MATDNKTQTTASSSKSEHFKKARHKADKLLMAALTVVGLLIFAVYGIQMYKKNQAADDPAAAYYVQVDVNNRAEALLPINRDGEFPFTNIYSDGENVVHIKDGKVSMHSANCPDQVCVYQGQLTPPTIVPIVCMPNVVYVSILERSEIDWSRIPEDLVPEELAKDYAEYQAAK